MILITIFIISTITTTTTTTACNKICGTGKSAIEVTYPFGFSDTCTIPLNCSSSGEITIDKYPIQKITQTSIFATLPADCNRQVDSLRPLFTPNYGFAWQNSLLFQNCINPKNDCQIPTSFFQDRLNLPTCESSSDNLTCFSDGHKFLDVLSYDNVTRSNCSVLFTSIALDSDQNPPVSMQFQAVELAWWLNSNGSCFCSDDANCTHVRLADGCLGFRCECKDGFKGDGYRNGTGCRKANNCNPSKYFSGHCGGTTRVGALIGGIVAGALLMAMLAVVCYFMRRKSASMHSQMSAKRLLSEATVNSSIPFYTYKEIEKSTNGFSEKQRLGTGAYGTVYAGKLNNDEWVAIKKIKHRDTGTINQVMNEIKLLSSVNHPNLVRLLGWCVEKGEQILVYEFMPNGTLSQHLQRERGKILPWTIRLTIAAETARAIAYLHSSMNPPIYHRDIKSTNILLDYNYNSKVADFGLSRLGLAEETSHISTAPQGTPGYLDPQYHQSFHLSDKSDVYSFGVVLVEIITALKVVDFTRPHSEINLAALAIDRIGRGIVDEIIDPFLELNRDAWTLSSVHKVAELTFRCLSFHRDMRPSMTEVADELEQIRLSGWAPMEDSAIMSSSSSSSCSSPFNVSERSLCSAKGKKKSIVELSCLGRAKDGSPISVHENWLSERSSPSTNSFLGNVVIQRDL